MYMTSVHQLSPSTNTEVQKVSGNQTASLRSVDFAGVLWDYYSILRALRKVPAHELDFKVNQVEH